MNPKPFNVAIAGFGRIADTHLEAWNSLEDTRVIAVVDDSPLARERARSMGMEAFEDIGQMLESGCRPNAVSICSPPVFHLTQTLSLMSEGVAVLCEKPVSVDLDNAQRLVEGAMQHKVPFQLATKFRHVPEIRKARDLVRHGVIGDPVTFSVEFAGSVDMSNRWNSVPQFSGGGVLIDNGCHAVDTVRFLLSGITKIQGVPLKPLQQLGVEDSAMMLATTECGTTGRIMMSWSVKSWKDTYITIQGTRGMIELGWKQSWLHVDGEAPVQIGTGYSKVGAHKRMMGMFRELCLGGNEMWITPDDVMASATVIEAAYRSMQSGRWARVPQPSINRHHQQLVASR